MPRRLDDLDGEIETLATKSEDVQRSDDIWEVRTAGSPGYGDPLKRDPEQVAVDVTNRLVSREAATDVYSNDVTVRQQATENRREELREKRLETSVVPIQEE